mmetsp:Transcript_67160/g.187977  ORF Transcript_67160/g.187977 Transcript_67160/m.187977 type:complete len:221 (+) Transcript_67160:106-768(+)
MKLHYLPPSANSHGPLGVVKALKMDVELENCYGKTRTEEFIKMNPCHTAPTLELDDGTAIWESNTVMRVLCGLAGEKGEALYPTETIQRAKIDMVMDWRQATMYPKLPAIGYIAFGMPCDDAKAKTDFATLLDEIFPVLTGTFLKDTQFIFSDKPTIADLSVAPPLIFIMARSKFWAKVPQEVKDYQTRVFEAFPDIKENFDMLVGMCEACTGESAEMEP